MLIPLLSTAIVLLVAWVVIRWYKVKRYWEERNVPHNPPHPLFGSLTFLQKKNPALWMREMYEEFRSPYVGIWLFWRPGLIINSPDIARRILAKDFSIFRNRFLSSGTKDPIGGNNLFTVNDPIWSEMRKRLSGMFTAAKQKHLHSFMLSKSDELVERIKADMREEGRVNLREMFSDFTTDVIGTTSFGVASDATLTGNSALRTVTREFMKYSFFRGLCWSSIFFFPELVDIFGFSFFPKSSIDYFRQVYHKIVAQRGGYDSISEHNDVIDMLRKIKQDYNKENKEIDEDILIAQAAIFLQGGFDTTSSALAFCVYELALLPEFQEKLYNELREVQLKKGLEDFNSLNDLIHLNCVLKETLRMYASMGWLDRVAAHDYWIDDNLMITAGTPVYINAYGMHYDPDLFPEPTKFKPERFLPENESNIQPYTYMPFGEGPRNCIGRRFASQNFLTGLSKIILTYKIVPMPDSKPPSDISIEKRGLLLAPGEEIQVKFVPRCT
ncbi:cytochrome P450 6k1-like [Battus philenor]|uniref:cytochrome P450 6k1-like n=1 Tax=Battus philenor TaxID=42288 RepID=UPI0035D0CCD3